MTDVSTTALVETKLYELCRQKTILEHMAPNIVMQMAAETELYESYPRKDDDGDATRIIINYVNAKGHSRFYQITDHDRLNLPYTFDIDKFLEDYSSFFSTDPLPTDPIERITFLVASGLSFSITAILDVGSTPEASRTRTLAERFLKAAIAIVYNDPLDVMMVAQETPSKDGTMSAPRLVFTWVLKQRPVTA